MDGDGALVILPTYNERENLPVVVPQVLGVLPRAHVLVVDDLSPDGTGDLADALAAGEPRVHVLHRAGLRGLGPAYLAGFRWALARDYRCVFEMDADLSHPPRYLPDLLRALEGADLVLGCRYMPGGGIQGWGPHRLLLSRAGNRYARAVLGLPYRDLTGGFKCFRRAVLEALDLEAVRSRGYGFQIELTWRAHRAGFRVAEVPIVFPDRERGVSKMSAAILHEATLEVLRLRLGG
ncbi:MAG: polyprenol monophosphomannose synthase [Alphaproteobacteria bacterium]|nr:polyprenol monophosphomannose synthase [Alphaproteobacteria bacterium]